jgi:hypothetical protein
MGRRATAIGALILVFVMAGTAFAASRGNPWRLGYVETLNAYVTGITGIHTVELLRIANTNGSSGARAIRAESKGTAAGTIYARNSGGGPAAEFVTNSGRAPFKVNRTTKVANLNADFVDGKNASSFVAKATLAGSTLPPGATMVGIFAVSGDAGVATDSISFFPHLAADIPLSNAHRMAVGITDANCPAVGQAAVGHFCLYEAWNNSMSFGGFLDPASSGGAVRTTGTIAYYDPTSGVGNVRGTWAVTAPSAAAASAAGPTVQAAPDSNVGR